MRLICPNCDAVYSVDDAAIPDAGRDVQCSNCGHAWFQMHPADAAATALDLPAEPAPDQPPPVAAPQTAGPAGEEDDDDDDEDSRAAPAPGDTVTGGAPAAGDTVIAGVTAARARLSDNLLAILREEAARETAERRAEAPRMPEVQPEFALAAAPPPPPAAPADLDALESGKPLADRPAPRRELLPDIEEINSTLRAGSEARGGGDPVATAARNRGGFRAGFVTMIVVAGLLVAAYAMAPRIAQYVPGAAPFMTRYVASMDRARLWVDRTMQDAAGALRGMTGEGG